VRGVRLPEPGRRSFDQLPATIERLLTGTTAGNAVVGPLLDERVERVVLVYLDAFGWRFSESLAGHSLLQRARSDGLVLQLTAQFPSTTTAHTTTIHSGLPVRDHGLYEWFVLEPLLDRLIVPLLFSFAGDGERERLAGVLDPGSVFPGDSLYSRLAAADVQSRVVQPASFATGSPNSILLAGADVLPSRNRAHALELAARAAAEPGYVHLYLPDVDDLMHHVGPDDPTVSAAFEAVLSDLAGTRFPKGTLVLLTADHGMAPVDPGRTIHVNELWPALGDLLERGADGKPLAPAGSCRDLFLHVRPDELPRVRHELADRLEGLASVLTSKELVELGAFEEPGAALRRRLANLVVLPNSGEAVYWHEPGRFEQRLRGQHGGLSPHEMEIPLVGWLAS
jgi:hypothetical protein